MWFPLKALDTLRGQQHNGIVGKLTRTDDEKVAMSLIYNCLKGNYPDRNWKHQISPDNNPERRPITIELNLNALTSFCSLQYMYKVGIYYMNRTARRGYCHMSSPVSTSGSSEADFSRSPFCVSRVRFWSQLGRSLGGDGQALPIRESVTAFRLSSMGIGRHSRLFSGNQVLLGCGQNNCILNSFTKDAATWTR